LFLLPCSSHSWFPLFFFSPLHSYFIFLLYFPFPFSCLHALSFPPILAFLGKTVCTTCPRTSLMFGITHKQQTSMA
jgi:hypothetical protein